MSTETVFITGASSGIGRAIAELLAREEYRVILGARREQLLGEVVEDIEREGGEAKYYRIDLADEESIKNCTRRLLNSETPPDILINNAGYGIYGLKEEIPLEEAREMFEVNFFGALSLTRHLLPALKNSESGRVVNIASGVAKCGFPVMNYYSASKAALESMSECLREELKPHGICVQVVYPLRTDTGFSASARRYVPEKFSFPSAGPTQAPGDVARAVLRGLQGTKFRIHPHFSTKLLGFLNEISPRLTSWLVGLQKIVRSARKD